MMYRCEQADCSFVSLTINDLLRHLRVVNHANFHCYCCFEGCNSGEFSTVSAFKSHIYRNHYEREQKGSTELQANEGTSGTDDYAESQMEADSITPSQRDPDLQADIDRLTGRDVVDQKRSSALFLLKLKEIHRVPQVAVDSVVSGSQEIFQQTVQRLKAGVQFKLAAAGVDEEVAGDVASVFDELSDPFAGLESQYKQNLYFTQEFQIPVSISEMHCEQSL